ncbi:MAG: hypothetical protein BroJett025_00200 [Patescibacteria group bacterium]|nr:MAG: hypothetical protein BroJett025_00200 [Patescibacteria group bacterium]
MLDFEKNFAYNLPVTATKKERLNPDIANRCCVPVTLNKCLTLLLPDPSTPSNMPRTTSDILE